jgi:hypothetical protein
MIMGSYELYVHIGFRFKVFKFWFQSFVFKFWVWILGLGFKFLLSVFRAQVLIIVTIQSFSKCPS